MCKLVFREEILTSFSNDWWLICYGNLAYWCRSFYPVRIPKSCSGEYAYVYVLFLKLVRRHNLALLLRNCSWFEFRVCGRRWLLHYFLFVFRHSTAYELSSSLIRHVFPFRYCCCCRWFLVFFVYAGDIRRINRQREKVSIHTEGPVRIYEDQARGASAKYCTLMRFFIFAKRPRQFND